MLDTIPELIGRYKVEKVLGQGAMGVVYLGYDEMIDRPVAIKAIRFDKISTEEEKKQSVDLFFREAKTIGKLNHSHITSIFDMGVHEEAPFIVMEYVEGKTIKEIIQADINMTVEKKITLISMIARGIHYAHQRGVLHRDIKPANIMVLPTLSPKVMDFGIALIKDSSQGESKPDEEDGVIMGTPHYMAPEQIRGQEMDQRSDVFSLGVLAYEWLSGRKPFAGKDLKEVISGILQKSPASLSELPDIDKNLEAIVLKAMEKKPADRYKDAEEFSDALEIYLSDVEKKREIENPNISGSYSFNQIRVIEQLRKNYVFFANFTEEEIFNIFRLSNKEKYEKGDVIIQEGTSGAKMYVILKGGVSIVQDHNGNHLELKKLGGGECFGEMSIIDKMPRSASVLAEEKTVVIAINEAVLRQLNPQLCLKLYRSLAAMISEKLRHSDKKYLDLLSSRQDDPD